MALFEARIDLLIGVLSFLLPLLVFVLSSSNTS